MAAPIHNKTPPKKLTSILVIVELLKKAKFMLVAVKNKTKARETSEEYHHKSNVKKNEK